MANSSTAIILILIGLFIISGGLFDWDWFMENRRAQMLVRTIGRTGTRIFYSLLGIAMIGMGIFGLFAMP